MFIRIFCGYMVGCWYKMLVFRNK